MTAENETPLDTMSTDDLKGLIEIANLVGAARDAMSDEIVTRMSGVMSEGLHLLDRLTRNEGLMQLLQVLDRPDSPNLLIALPEALYVSRQETAAAPPAKGGIGCLLRVARAAGTLEGIRCLASPCQHRSHRLGSPPPPGGEHRSQSHIGLRLA